MTTRHSWEPALSATRAKEYQRCPLQYRLHVVDGMKEPPTRATVMGTLVHSALEDLFSLPAQQRTAEQALALLEQVWTRLREKDPSVEALLPTQAGGGDESRLAEVRDLVVKYFQVENPQFLSPAAREHRSEAVTPGGVRLRGFIDRIDRAPTGALRVVDYKTGKAPSPRFVDEALYQMRFYALLLMLGGHMPARLQLLYLRSGQVLTLDPDREDIVEFGRGVEDLWAHIEADAQAGHFAPRRNPLCNWCGVQSACPEFGGTTPPVPTAGIEKLLATRVQE